MNYKDFLDTKRQLNISYGIPICDSDVNPKLYDFQRDLVKWAVKKGRSAIFADCGLGKTFIQLEWARLIGQKTLIIAPLSVARQTVKEGLKIQCLVKYCRGQEDTTSGINITNYEMIEHFTPDLFDSVILDESSILKSLTGKTRSKLIEMFSDTKYRLCCTATPAPNDIAEIANHAEFLGIESRMNMLATYFVHDDAGWRLKGHATEAFYKWLASWAMYLRKPSELGYDDNEFILPNLSIEPVIITNGYKPQNQLFFTGLKGISDRSEVRHHTLSTRIIKVAEMINSDNNQWIAWCGLNDEASELAKAIPEAVNVEGSQSPEYKAHAIEDFQDGKYRILITKPKIAGFGMNLQNACRMVFVGLSDSYESYYQCLRRSWRFGQRNPVKAYIVLSDIEEAIYRNVLSKEKEAKIMGDKMIANVGLIEQEEIRGQQVQSEYKTDVFKTEDYTLFLGDSAEKLKDMESNSISLSVYSPPFLSLYTYSPTERDIGNSKTTEEFYNHYGFIIRELLRVTKTGRNTCCHVSQVPAMLVRDGYIGLKDFRGLTIKAYEDNGWIYHGEVVIDKDPQAQAIRTHSKGLLFTQLKKDASWLRPALCDYILVFRKPGDNEVVIKPDLTNDEWIEWARPIWYGIKESDTLNVHEASDDKDERHICPLQLGTIERCIRLWSNEGETVLSPFMGIGSEGYEAIRLNRKYIGIELKESYYKVAIKNLATALSNRNARRLI